MEETRFLGIDYGQRRLGVAISDPTGTIARSLDTLIVTGDNDAVKQIKQLADEYQPAGIVIGLPLNLSGDESELSQKVKNFGDKLEKVCSVRVYLEDERLTSRLAENVLHAHGKKIKGHKEKIDRISATLILQTFLDRRGRENGSENE